MQTGTLPPLRPLIVVPCLNEARHIGPLIRQFAGAAARLGGTLVVVDGGSTDATRDIVRREAAGAREVHLIDNPARIQSAGINRAVARFGADATHLVRVDAHCAYPERFCEILLEEARATGAASVVVTMEAQGTGIIQRAIAAAQNAPVGNGGSKHRNATAGEYVDHGHHALIAIDAFDAVGGYDAGFAHNEDAEFDHRLALAGHRIWLSGRVAVTYFPRSDAPRLARQYFNHGSGRARNMLKHRMRPKVRQAAVIAVLPAVAAAALAPAVPVFALPGGLWAAFCAAMAASLAAKGRDPALLVAAPMAMVMHLAWSAGFWATLLRARATVAPSPA
ncbi:MAG: glycosyltransferase family 2 protein [Paracoccaceae bacterium]|nr:glycosyltransferase family 2 protein [Paracoccaceae bacterium]